MTLGKIVGNLVATTIMYGYENKKIFFIQPIDPQGNPSGKTFLAVDAVQAGIGDTVLVMEEGGSARWIIEEPKSLTVKSVVAGIVDEVRMY